MNNKEISYAYMAGFVDANGSISIVSLAKTKQYIIKISVCNRDKTVIDLFKKEFSGEKVRKRIPKNVNWRPIYVWSRTSLKAKEIIEKLLPYLRIKKKQAKLTIKAQKIKSSGLPNDTRWKLEKFAKRQEKLRVLKEECNLLNKRGT